MVQCQMDLVKYQNKNCRNLNMRSKNFKANYQLLKLTWESSYGECSIISNTRVKSGNFGQRVNSDIGLQTVKIQTSRLIRIFIVCLLNLIFIPIIQKYKKQARCPNLADCPNLPDFPLVACHKGLDKQRRPKSDCFRRSSLIRVFPVCYSDKYFAFPALTTNISLRTGREKCLKSYLDPPPPPPPYLPPPPP